VILGIFFENFKFEFGPENPTLISRFYFPKIDENIKFFMKIEAY
jgi:hypothetical protein